MIRRALARADRILTVSYNSKRDLVDSFGVPAARIEVIYNGVSTRFRPDVPAEERAARRALKYGLPTPYLLFLGGETPAQEPAGRRARVRRGAAPGAAAPRARRSPARRRGAPRGSRRSSRRST